MKKILLPLFLFLFLQPYSQIVMVSTGATYTENFNGMSSTFKATIPSGFRIGADWTTGSVLTDTAMGTTGTSNTLSSTSKGYCYNFANGNHTSATDRALGFLMTNSYSSGKNIILKITNNTGVTITQLDIIFDYEKYRSGSRQWDWTFFHGATSTASTADVDGNQTYAADANNNVVSNPPTSINKIFSISSISIPDGTDYYLRWKLTGSGGSTNGQALGIDNFQISVGNPILPISLGDFTVENIKNKNLCRWETYSEYNVDKFVIQRSYKALEWSEIGVVNAFGNSSLKLIYDYADATYDLTEPIIYYRLKIIDNDGNQSFSNMYMINNTSATHQEDYKYYNMLGEEIFVDEFTKGYVFCRSQNRLYRYCIIQ